MNALWIKVQRALDNAFTKQIVVFVKWCWSRWHPLPTTVKVGITSLFWATDCWVMLIIKALLSLRANYTWAMWGVFCTYMFRHGLHYSVLAAFIAAVGALWTSKFGWDALVGACSESVWY